MKSILTMMLFVSFAASGCASTTYPSLPPEQAAGIAKHRADQEECAKSHGPAVNDCMRAKGYRIPGLPK